MIAKGELKIAEQEARARWTGLLALSLTLRRLRTRNGPGQSQIPSVVLLLANNDEAANLRATLQADGISTQIAGTLEEGIALTADENAKLLVVEEIFIKSASDCWQFRKDRVFPVVVMGTSPEREGWDKAVNFEADAYLPKYMSLAEQVARIKAVLRRA